MDGSFACPECGSEVQVRGLAPGRQVRCGFCHTLLEVPYLPRAADAPWKRRRFVRPRWVKWAWAALALIGTVVLVAGCWRFLKRQYDSYQERSVTQLLESSRRHEAGGRLGQALIDLDAALELAGRAGPGARSRVSQEQKKRPDLARRDAGEILNRLSRHEPPAFSVGAWLNLRARAAKDPDLAPLVDPIEAQFQSELQRQVEIDLNAARRAFESAEVVAAVTYCDQIPSLVRHLAPKIQPAVLAEAEQLVTQFVSTHGVNVEAPQGHFLFGSKSYVSEMLPILVKALEAKAYLTNRESSPWRGLWRHALYQIRLDVSEVQEGNYLSSPNRLTRIQADLTLTSHGEVIWRTKPTALSKVPLPNLPAGLASRGASGEERSEAFEQLLYNNARDQINEVFRINLGNMPVCPSSRGAEKP